MLGMKSFKNHKKFFVIYVTVKFYGFEYMEVECNQVYFFFFCYN